MGTFSYPITLISPAGDGTETLTGLVDTVATFSSAPAPMLVNLEVVPQWSARLGLADGRVVEH